MLNREYENQQVTTYCTFSVILCIAFLAVFCRFFPKSRKMLNIKELLNLKQIFFYFYKLI